MSCKLRIFTRKKAAWCRVIMMSINTFSLLGKSPAAVRSWLTDRHLLPALEAAVTRPLIPLPDNFTPPTRTPWGGTKVGLKYKQGLPFRAERQYHVIGESWEISADPAAPSQFILQIGGETILLDLIQILELFPAQILGAQVAAKFAGQNPILVKMLDAADDLSVQVHPSDDYAGLRPDESGKTESWYILEAEPGCGLYFGLKTGVTKDRLRQALEREEDVSQCLNFVEVKSGDFFVIEAGTIHAIGAGVTLIEPQKIAPKKSGKTYRLWDWNRKYDAQGNLDPHGKPRELHIEDSLQVIRFDGPRGAEFIRHIQPQRRICQQYGQSAETVLVETEHFGVSQLELYAGDRLEQWCVTSFHGIVLYAGRLSVLQHGQLLADIRSGQSIILPASLETYTLQGDSAKAVKVYSPAQYL